MSKQRLIKSYGYKVSRRPEFAGVDKDGIFFPVLRADDPQCVGSVVRVSIPKEAGLAKLWLEWEVMWWMERPYQTIDLERFQGYEAETTTSFHASLEIPITCSLKVISIPAAPPSSSR